MKKDFSCAGAKMYLNKQQASVNTYDIEENDNICDVMCFHYPKIFYSALARFI